MKGPNDSPSRARAVHIAPSEINSKVRAATAIEVMTATTLNNLGVRMTTVSGSGFLTRSTNQYPSMIIQGAKTMTPEARRNVDCSEEKNGEKKSFLYCPPKHSKAISRSK